MNTNAQEYLSKESQDQSTASPGNKKFSIVRAEDETVTSIAPRLRTEVRKLRTISDGAKVLYDELSDLSFWPKVTAGPGVVRMSKQKLGKRLGVSYRTIARRSDELESHRKIWTTTEWYMGFEITYWHLRGLADSQTELWQEGHPSCGNGSRKGTRYHAARGERGKWIKNGNGNGHASTTDNPDIPVKSAVLPDLSRDHGQDCPETTVRTVLRQRTKLS